MLDRTTKQTTQPMQTSHKDTNNIIQGLWFGPRLSRFEYNSIKSYLKQGYEYHLYTYGKVENIPDGVIIKDGNEILDKKYIFHYEGSIAPFSDIFRYKLLYERGGVWTDCDIICVKRLPDDTKHKYIFVAERTILKGAFASCIKTPPYTCKKKKVLNSFIRTPPNAPIMLQMF
jgi:mannosyltransferase OCH1-like enzyme